MTKPGIIALVALAAAGASASTAQAASFKCSASAGRISVLGHATEPVTANTAGTACAGDNKTLTGPAAGFTGPLTLGALLASTEVFPAQKSVVATGGVADLKVAALPGLPITLPQVAVPDAARAALANALKVDVDLAPVKALIPVLDTSLPTNLVTNLVTTLQTDLVENLPVNLPTNLPVNLPTNLPTNLLLDLLNPLLDTPLKVLAANDANAATNAANTLTNSANAATNAANTLTNAANLATNTANAALNAANLATNAANLATNAANTLTNAANLATNTANAALNAVRAAIPNSVAVDRSGALDGLLGALLPSTPGLPNLDLLKVQGALAYAAGACKNGTASVAGSSSVTGLNVLGADLSADTVIDQVRTLINSLSIDPSNLALPTVDLSALGLTQPQLDLINSIPLGVAGDALTQALQTARTAIDTALDGIDTIQVLPATVAQIKVTPGARLQDATSVTQQALKVLVTIAGQQVLDAVIGEAKASSAGVDCDDPVTDPAKIGDGDKSTGGGSTSGGSTGSGDSSNQPATPEEAALQCSDRRIVLVDVLERGNRVVLNGVAATSYAGKTVDIVFNATGDVVAHAKIAHDGSFDTTAPLPPERLRDTNDARYQAIVGKEESINLKLRRRMIVTSMTSDNGKVTIAGRVLPPLGKPLQAVTLRRRTSCKTEQVVTRFRPGSDGRFRITVKAPKGVGTAVYRMTTKVRVSAQGTGMFDTYTLPRAVDLDR
ncbi:MAG: hypothetical protein ACJ762_20835 [Solirubrobacteraceae bacterium]